MAKDKLNEAIELMEYTSDRNLGLALHNLAECYSKEGNQKKAAVLFIKSLERKVEIQDSVEIAITENEIGKLFIGRNNEKAKIHLNNASICLSRFPNNFVKKNNLDYFKDYFKSCLLYTSPSPRDRQKSRMPSSA